VKHGATGNWCHGVSIPRSVGALGARYGQGQRAWRAACARCTSTCCANSLATAGMQTLCASSTSTSSPPTSAHQRVVTPRVAIIPLHLVGDDVARDEGEGSRTRRSGAGTTSPFGRTSLIWCERTLATPTGSCASPSPSSCTCSGYSSRQPHRACDRNSGSRSATATAYGQSAGSIEYMYMSRR